MEYGQSGGGEMLSLSLLEDKKEDTFLFLFYERFDRILANLASAFAEVRIIY